MRRLRSNVLITFLLLLLGFMVTVPAGNAGAQTQASQAPSSQTPAPSGDVIPPLPDDQQPPAAQTPPAQPPAEQQAPAPPPTQSAPAQPSSTTTAAPDAPNQPGNTVQVPVQKSPGQSPTREDNGVYVFRKQVEEVVLHATVVDDRRRLITDLKRNDFTVLENGTPQQITSFRREDIPVALGIVIDNSGSMRDKRPAVNQATLNLIRASNPQDEVFVVNFNDEYYLDQDYTNQVPKLREALERIESRGGTALYDAVVASADHLMKQAKLEKRVLLVVTDGEDNASRESLEQALRRLAVDGGPTVYTIGILGEEKQRRARRALTELSENTGGVSFFPKDLSEVDAISQEVARDIRNQYTIGYKPVNPQRAGGYRTVKVEAHASGYKKLMVRTRTGYYAGQERAAK